MAGRAKGEVAQPIATDAAKAALVAPSAPHNAGTHRDTGKALANPVVTHDKGVPKALEGGIKVEAFLSKPIEAGYIEPVQRNNQEYIDAQKAEKAAHKAPTPAVFGYGRGGVVLGASPNSPLASHKSLY